MINGLNNCIFNIWNNPNLLTFTPIEFNHCAIVLVLVSCVLPDRISLPIISIAALNFVFWSLLNIQFKYGIYQSFNKRQTYQTL